MDEVKDVTVQEAPNGGVKSIMNIEDNDLLVLAESIEKRVIAYRRIRTNLLRVTDTHDWVDQGGKPYLQESGIEKIRTMVRGLRMEILTKEKVSLPEGHYRYNYSVKVTFSNTEITAEGSRSSRDDFFKQYFYVEKNQETEKVYGKEKTVTFNDKTSYKILKPASEINEGNVMKAALTNAWAGALKRLFGLQNLSWDDLKEAGIKVDEITKVDYKSKKAEKKAWINHEPEKKELTIRQKIGILVQALAKKKNQKPEDVYHLFATKSRDELTDQEAQNVYENIVNALGQEGIDVTEILE